MRQNPNNQQFINKRKFNYICLLEIPLFYYRKKAVGIVARLLYTLSFNGYPRDFLPYLRQKNSQPSLRLAVSQRLIYAFVVVLLGVGQISCQQSHSGVLGTSEVIILRLR